MCAVEREIRLRWKRISGAIHRRNVYRAAHDKRLVVPTTNDIAIIDLPASATATTPTAASARVTPTVRAGISYLWSPTNTPLHADAGRPTAIEPPTITIAHRICEISASGIRGKMSGAAHTTKKRRTREINPAPASPAKAVLNTESRCPGSFFSRA